MTLQTIADRVGVSRMTVSNAFSRPDQLSADLRDRILGVADELGYAGPDPAGRALRSGTTGAIGIMLTDTLDEAFTDDIATAFLAAIAAELERSGMALTLLTAGLDRDAATVAARDVAIDGALLYSCRPTSPGRDWLLRRKLPIVFVDQDPVEGIPAVNVDDRGGAAAAARHLVELGHRDVALMTYVVPDHDLAPDDGERPVGRDVTSVAEADLDGHGRSERERLLGWFDGLARAPAGRIRLVDLHHAAADDEIREVARRLLADDDRPTAVICFSDVMALDVLGVAAELGLDVPRDLSVVGSDDARSARFATPALTTVRQDVVEKGRAAAAELLSLIAVPRRSADGAPARINLPTELVVRDSTGPPPGSGGKRKQRRS